MRGAIKHIWENPFITATAIAALVHSTWSLGTLMSGNQPTAGVTVEFLGWLAPALLIAFALDVGQVVTSSRIRHNGITWQSAVTFGVFSFATYYLQLMYMIHHVPSLSLADGVRSEWSGMVTLIRDASIWLIPALLPLSTLLYTLSAENRHFEPVVDETTTTTLVTIETDPLPLEMLPMGDAVDETPRPTNAQAETFGKNHPDLGEKGSMLTMQTSRAHTESVNAPHTTHDN